MFKDKFKIFLVIILFINSTLVFSFTLDKSKKLKRSFTSTVQLMDSFFQQMVELEGDEPKRIISIVDLNDSIPVRITSQEIINFSRGLSLSGKETFITYLELVNNFNNLKKEFIKFEESKVTALSDENLEFKSFLQDIDKQILTMFNSGIPKKDFDTFVISLERLGFEYAASYAQIKLFYYLKKAAFKTRKWKSF